MNCPSCSAALESNARFCGVCGYRLQAPRAPTPAPGATIASASGVPVISPAGAVAPARAPAPQLQAQPQMQPQAQPKPLAQPPRPRTRSQLEDLLLNSVLNNRFKIESKIGEGGFGSVYRGTQLATGRKVALKLLHPEMTKDENLVNRFRREGMVLCNLRDAHTITTYDFDRTPDGTLYIAMELLEGKSLHQIFHEQAPLEWKRVFKILTEMCSSLAEAHAQGIVHRDLKPENIYLENRPGNPEFVKILDFGIAKVMRGDTIDPQSPQLTATGQTLGTLEYMSPEQLMGKALDGRSDVYALGVVAYEMITGRLPFPDAKGPAGLITAQLKQTPAAPSTVNTRAGLPPSADRLILKCLEKDKNNRFADVTLLASALQEVLTEAATGASSSHHRVSPEPDPRAMAAAPSAVAAAYGPPGYPQPQAVPHGHLPAPGHAATPPAGAPNVPGASFSPPAAAPLYPQASQTQLHAHQTEPRVRSSARWVWWIVGLLAIGAAAGAVLALVMS
ncbi:MAG: protein kinase [Kofleriaceae bacterium]